MHYRKYRNLKKRILDRIYKLIVIILIFIAIGYVGELDRETQLAEASSNLNTALSLK